MIHALLYTLLFAFLSSLAEDTWRISNQWVGNTKKLPHAWLAMFRGVVIGIINLWIYRHHFDWLHVPITLLALLLVFAPVHRFFLNLFSHNPFFYMGPTVRDKGDSWYDTMWMWWAAEEKSTKVSQSGTITTYVLIRPWLPFVLCTAFETLCAAGLFALNAQLN